jgi:plasmid stability protein
MSKHVQIRDVPDDVHALLRVRAAQEGLSLSEYLRRELAGVAARSRNAEVLARSPHRGRGGVTFEQAAADIRQERDSR